MNRIKEIIDDIPINHKVGEKIMLSGTCIFPILALTDNSNVNYYLFSLIMSNLIPYLLLKNKTEIFGEHIKISYNTNGDTEIHLDRNIKSLSNVNSFKKFEIYEQELIACIQKLIDDGKSKRIIMNSYLLHREKIQQRVIGKINNILDESEIESNILSSPTNISFFGQQY